MEFISECCSGLSISDIIIGKLIVISEVLRILQVKVFITQLDDLAFFYDRHIDFKLSDKSMSKIIYIAIVTNLMNCYRLVGVIDCIQLTHLSRCLMVWNISDNHLLPG